MVSHLRPSTKQKLYELQLDWAGGVTDLFRRFLYSTCPLYWESSDTAHSFIFLLEMCAYEPLGVLLSAVLIVMFHPHQNR